MFWDDYDDIPVGPSHYPSERYLDAMVYGTDKEDDPYGFRKQAREAREAEAKAQEEADRASRAFRLTETAAKGGDASPDKE